MHLSLPVFNMNRKLTVGLILLLPFSFLYGLGVRIRNLMFDWNLLPVNEFRLPVLSVGNITAGGTGKTPHVEYLTRLLENEFSIAILSRGYKRKTREFIIADMESSAEQVGDEPRQLKQKFPGSVVAVDRRRANGIRKLLALDNPVDLILLDDAFQHRYVKPGKSILLMDYHRLVSRDFLLPAGRLREPASGMKRADIILITKTPERLKPIEMRNIVKELGLELHQHLYFTSIEYLDPLPVFERKTPMDPGLLKSRRPDIILLTGIANPRPMRKFARSISTRITEISYPDHHRYTRKDLQQIQTIVDQIENPERIILTTEKDAMRLQGLEIGEEIKNILYFVPIGIKFLHDDQEEFDKIIFNYVRSNKRNNILHKQPVKN